MQKNVPSDRSMLLRLGHAARLIDISPESLRQLLRQGVLPRVRIGRRVFVRRVDLEDFLSRLAREGVEP